jgi:hypothetical protein
MKFGILKGVIRPMIEFCVAFTPDGNRWWRARSIVVLNLWLRTICGNPLIKDENDHSWVPGDIGNYQLKHWRLCGHAVKGVPLKIRVLTNQKSELMAAWNKDAIHVTSEFHLPASILGIIRLKKASS